jgi:RNA recognition motif-containing protein
MSRALANNDPSKKMQLRFDRFTFQNDRRCFVELASEQQAQDAIQRLQKKKLQGQTLVVKPLVENFIWGRNSEEGRLSSRHFFDEGKNAAEAIKPLLEDRRYMLLVQTPGWQDSKKTNEAANEVLEKHFEPFGVETRSMLRPMFGDKKPEPRLLCFIDFTTKEGAEKAVEAIHEKTIEGRRTKLLSCKLSAWRAHQIGKVDAGLLKQLQEKEIAPKETREDRFVKGPSPSS